MKTVFTWILGLCFVSLSAQEFTLAGAVDYAVANSNSLEMGDLDIETAEYQIKEVRSIGLPKVNGGIDYSYYFYVPKQPVQDFIGPTVYTILEAENLATAPTGPPRTFELSFVQPQSLVGKVGVNQLIFDGSYLYGLKAASIYRELAQKQKNATEQTVRSEVTKAYLSVLIANENIKTLDDNLSTLNTSLKEVEALYKEGFAESLDVDRLKLTIDELTTQKQNVQELIGLSKNLLKFQMSYPLEDEIILTEGLDELIKRFQAEMLSDVRVDPSQRAEYELLETNQALNELDMKRHKAGYYPSVAGFANFQESLQRSNLFDNDQAGWLPTGILGLAINIPIYDGGEKSAKIQKTRINMEKVEIQKEEFVRGMNLQVQNALAAYNNATRLVANRKKAEDMSQSIYDRTKIKFKEGVGSSVEVNQAESALFNAQNQYISALYDLLKAKVDLDIALGKV